jgi:hypothetical protein
MAESAKSPPGTIKKRLHAARGRLSKLLYPRVRAQAALATSERSAHGIGAPEGESEREE